jgi:non-specific serine/threonine protein kinase
MRASERLQRVIDHYSVPSLSRHNIIFGADLRTLVFINLSVTLLSRGLLDAAASAAVTAIEMARGTHGPATLCFALAGAAGFVFLSLGELDIAARHGSELVDHAHKHALRPLHATGLCVCGSLAVKRADPNAGIDPLCRGLAGMREATLLLYYPYFMAEYAAALGAIGRSNDGVAEINAALRIATETGYRWFVPEILTVKGELLALRGSDDVEVIEGLFRGSMSLAHEQQALYWELSAAISLTDLLRSRNRGAEARAMLARCTIVSLKAFPWRKCNAPKCC